MSETILNRQRSVWLNDKILRAIYTEWYRLIRDHLKPGKTLEIGGGCGNLKEFAPDVISSDILEMPWIDLVLDAHWLPIKSEILSNIVLFDVLHHLENPSRFFHQALTAISPGGRLICIEPYISPVSFLVYRFFHPEPLDFRLDPFEKIHPAAGRKPFDANQAIPTILFYGKWPRFQERHPRWKMLKKERMALFAYPLSGGFGRPALFPYSMLEAIMTVERKLSFLAPLLAFRMVAILEKPTI